MNRNLYDSLATEWRDALKSGAIFRETDRTYYARPEVKQQFDDVEPEYISMLDIATATAHHFNMSRAELMCHSRQREFTRPRFVAIHLIREILPHVGTVAIGRLFNRDHTTICNALGRAVELVKTDQSFREAVIAVRSKLA